MLSVARKDGVYKNYIEALLLEDTPLPVADNEYDLVVAAGVFIPGHIPWNAFRQMIKIVKKGN